MKQLLKDIFYSFPIQLFILHFRKYQVLLIFWYLLTSTINSGFMKTFGADALFFAPEYLGNVNAISAVIVGVAMGIFIMSWNITTFILHSKRCKFLATTSKPFLKYCLNNSLLPLAFIVFYFVRLYPFDRAKELMGAGEIIILMLSILGGFILLIAFSFAYFFGAEMRIMKSIMPIMNNPYEYKKVFGKNGHQYTDKFGMKVSYYFSTGFQLRKPRNVSHYSPDFMDLVFKRHHFAAMISISLAFISLITVGFLLDHKIFQVPAAASIFVFFGIMIAVIGALTYFLQSWSLPFIIVLLFLFNILYEKQIIDPRNKAYGINYTNKDERPAYNRQSLQELCTPDHVAADKANMIAILDNWKKKQTADKPIMVFINVSGGGLRSATFVMNTLQQLDSITNGKLMQQTVLMSGASGGMLAATYYRELYRQKQSTPSLNLHDPKYTDNIAQDLLNPVFSSLAARDIFAPAQKFSIGNYKYVKDRGYGFEQKLADNTEGLLDKQLKDYVADERSAKIPLIFFNSVVSRDGRKMMISSQPISFMMKPLLNTGDTTVSPDAIDFAALFAKQDPMNIRLLTALRMNATFPYVLPNVWLPTNPIIDVMDAGLRDNFGQETTLRFIDNFKDWIQKNTGGVLILQMRDRLRDNWQQPENDGTITDIIIKPGTMLQNNWFKLQDYSETDQYSYFNDKFDSTVHRVTFMYVPEKEQNGAALNFHLTASEKRDIRQSFSNTYNNDVLKGVVEMLK